MSRPLLICLACLALVGGAAGAWLLLRDDGGGEGSAPRSAASLALLQRGGGPDGSATVTLTRWRYRADPRDRGLAAGWATGDWRGRDVRLPHSPNARAHNGPAGRRAYAGSVGWYAREIEAPVAGHYALRFESAHYRAAVYVDGHLLRRHVGAYEPFSARPALAAGRHVVAVRVDWRDPRRQADEDWQRGWFNYGGLQRPVLLSRLGPSELGALRVRTRLRGAGRARVDVTVRVRNRVRGRRVRLTGSLVRDGEVVALRFASRRVPRNGSRALRASVVLDDPALWAPEHPDRYELRLAVAGEASLRREVGLREVTWDGDGLYVNGEPLVLRGAALPADARGHGDALTARDEERLIAGLRAIGANATRSQLPLAQSMLERLDAAGIFVWQELGPWEPAGRWRAITPAAQRAVGDRALRTAEDDQPHASILAWTLTNEAPGHGRPGQQQYVARTARRLHAFDPGRPVAADLWGRHLPSSGGPLFDELDAIGVTDYIGWYEGPESASDQAALASHRIALLRGLFAGKPLVVTELGAAGSRRTHGAAFGGLRYQAQLLQRRIAGLRAEPELSGVIVWTLRDYALRPDFIGGSVADRRPDLRLTPGLNEKGLYDFAGQPKPALAAVRRAFGDG
ncbi:MAG: beta-galactosidase [Solirubrobacteraceae bacterium]|nr:beta-galactosidase [Solirubrobacteraceae bacterium]